MQLEWFRHHKKFVYMVLAPIVILSFAFLFGQGDALNRGGRGGKGGPSVSVRVGNTEKFLSPSEVVALRFLLTQYGYSPNGYRDNHVRTSDEAAYHLVSYGTASAAGFGIGKAELQERLWSEVKNQIQKRDGTQPEKRSEALYHKLLETMQLTPTQFERMVEEFGVIDKYMRYVYGQARASDEELFIAYLADKEVVRLRYKILKSEDFLDKTKTPEDAKIKEFYEKHKADKETVRELKDLMFTKPKLSADILFMDTDKTFADLKPSDGELMVVYEKNKAATPSWKLETKAGEPEKFKPFADVKAEVEAKWKEEEIKKYYERTKRFFWKIEPPKDPKDAKDPKDQKDPKDTKPPAPPEEKFKPLEEVKAEVEKKWHGEWLADQQRARMESFKRELLTAEKDFNKTQEGKKPEEKAKFDIAAWAKSKNLGHWATEELYEEDFNKGKFEVNAKDAKWASELFMLKQDSGIPYLNSSNAQKIKEFGPVKIVAEGGKGLVSTRIKNYKDEEALPLEQAKAGIIAHLKVDEAIELAEKEAKKNKTDWAAGNNLPAIDSLEEVKGDRENKHAALKEYFHSPKGIGEPIEVAEAQADESPQSTNRHVRYYVAFPVERELPTRKTFHDDTAWPRDQKRAEIERSNFYAIAGNLSRQMREMGKVVGDINGDPPLFDEYRKGNE